jgi:putative aldouronate transport system substrate-binding protein
MKKNIPVLIILITAIALAATGCDKSSRPSHLTVEIFDRGSDGGRTPAWNNAWTNWIKEKVKADLNIDITFVPVGRWSEDTDIVNLMASGNAPDLCYTYNTGMINSFRDQGGIMDISPYIDSHLPDMKKLLGADPAFEGQELIYRDRDPVTGRIYSVPNYVVNIPQRNIFIRKDWLDKLGMPLPKTTQEFYDALTAFRNQDPGNIGKSNVIPFGQNSDARWGFANIVHAFFDPTASERDMWIAWFSDRPIMVPGYKEGIRMMNKWYNEGLILRDFPIMRVADDFFALLKTGRIGAYSGNWDHPYRQDYRINEELAMNVPGAEFVPVDCIQSPDGINRKYISDKPGLRIFIPSSSKNYEAALRYLNWLCLYENFHFLQIGTEGVNHELVDGLPKVIPTPPGHPWMQNSPNNVDLTLPINQIEMLDPELNARVLALGYGKIPSEVIVNAYNMSISNGKVPPVYQAVTTLDGLYGQSLRDKADTIIAQSVTASITEFNRVWDAGIRDYLSSGAKEVMDERAALWK